MGLHNNIMHTHTHNIYTTNTYTQRTRRKQTNPLHTFTAQQHTRTHTNTHTHNTHNTHTHTLSMVKSSDMRRRSPIRSVAILVKTTVLKAGPGPGPTDPADPAGLPVGLSMSRRTGGMLSGPWAANHSGFGFSRGGVSSVAAACACV